LFLAGQDGVKSRLIKITNATFTNITIEGPVEQVVYVKQCTMVLDATQINLINFQGEVKHESPLACTNTKPVVSPRQMLGTLPFQETGQALVLVLTYFN
jgi:hypothetical protein